MSQKPQVPLSRVETIALQQSPFDILYPPEEHIPTLVVEHFPALGKLTAMRFLEWAQDHEGGVISLPTGKTPEHFIKWVRHLMAHWEEPEVQKELEQSGVDPARKPDMRSFHFVQIDEFYPINPTQHNSFYYYIKRFYIEGFGLDERKAMLIDGTKIGIPEGETLNSIWPDQEVDLSLRYRAPRTALERKQKYVLEAVDQWCQEYEERIRAMGGIGFFLGGIGPDGHIGFNVRGSDHHSTTRLTPTNYETQAAAATDLGGIEVARKRLVITIGLGTITYNPECVAIIIAAGEAKAGIVASAIQNRPHVRYPATALQSLKHARFYLTLGAAKHLHRRQLVLWQREERISESMRDTALINLAIRLHKPLLALSRKELQADPFARLVLERSGSSAEQLVRAVHDGLEARLQRGMTTRSGTTFLHTEPHHDDLMLGYLPFIVRHIRDASNTHYFACLTSGFTAVTNQYMHDLLCVLKRFLDTPGFRRLMEEKYFHPANKLGRHRDVWQYLDGVASNRQSLREEGAARRLLRNLIEVYDESDPASLKNRIDELIFYFETQYPGKKDLPHIQRLKGMCREWEAECLWGYFGWSLDNVLHLRLGFYTGDIFTEEPTVDRDVLPILEQLRRIQPDVVTVAFDPEASGPDTHYKVLQAITEALKRYEQESGRSDIKVWGYRNVWYRFHPAEANIYVPVSLNMFSIMHSAFMNTFISQKNASFPSYEHDGPFSELAQKIQVEQYQMIKTCLGREWFHEHPSPLIRATRGLVFLKEMTLPEFYEKSRRLRQLAENR